MKTERYYVSENVTLTVEVSTGRLDIIVRRYYGNNVQTDFWYATRDTKTKKWDLNYCFNGFCYNSAKLTERFASRSDVISYLSELATRIYNEGYEKMIVSELTTFETILFDDKKNVPVEKELTETPADNEHEETINFYHVRDTKTGTVENVFATSEESAKRLVFGRRDTTKSSLVIEPVTVDGIALETTVCSLDGYTGIKIKCGNRTYYYRTRRENTNWVLYELQDGFDTYGLDDMVLYHTRKEAIASAEKHVQKRVKRIAEFKAMKNRRETVSDTDNITCTKMTESETKYCVNDINTLNCYVDTDSVKTRGTKKHYYKMNSMGQWYELNKNNFMILWTSEIKFHVYLNEKCIGHGEIKHDKSGFMYDTDNYYGFIKCDVENVTIGTIRKKVRTRMLEYYADEITETCKDGVIK